jgi:hypothetical protein
MMTETTETIKNPPRRQLARRLAVVTPWSADDIESRLCVLTPDEIERFLACDDDQQALAALDIATLRYLAPNAGKGLTYPALQLHPLPDDRPIPNGAHRSVKGSRGWYTVCNHGGRLFCDCPSFAFSKEPQSCKHVRGLVPAQYGKRD